MNQAMQIRMNTSNKIENIAQQGELIANNIGGSQNEMSQM